MKYFASIIAATSLAITSTSATGVWSNIGVYFYNNLDNMNLYDGFVLGL